MPYQGPGGYVPPNAYANYQAGQSQYYNQQNGQARPQGNRQPQQMSNPQQFQRAEYHHDPSHAQTQYATQQYMSQGQPSFYQVPSPSVQYQQQPYLSPPLPQQDLWQNVQYSPDPLHYYQPPPQPRPAAPHGYQQPQQQQQQQQQQPSRTPSQSTHVQQPPPRQPRPQSGHQQAPSSNQWPSFPASPYESSATSNTGSVARNSQQQRTVAHIPPHQRLSSQQAPIQQSSKIQPSSDAMRRTFAHNQQMPSGSPTQPQSARNHNYQDAAPLSSGTINPQVLQTRKITRPPSASQLPPSKPLIKEEEYPPARSPKRRRSNEGSAIPVFESKPKLLVSGDRYPDYPPQRSKPSIHAPVMKQEGHPPPAASPRAKLAPSHVTTTSASANNFDYQSLLLALSDEYVEAAYSLTPQLATAEVDEDILDQYQCLLANGMGCLETVLTNYSIADKQQEARIRLRLASLIYEETCNDRQAEETLSKGIALCERSKLHDLKYAMHHLLARIAFRGSTPKSALTAVDRIIVEVEKLGQLHWVYAFRFLRVSFSITLDENRGQASSITKNLAAIVETATRNYHVAVQIVASALEALMHLQTRAPDGTDQAMRSLAAARRHQLTDEMTGLPQVKTLLDYIDLACALSQNNHNLANTKMQTMQATLDDPINKSTRRKGNILYVPLGLKRQNNIETDTGGIMTQLPNGEAGITLSWLTDAQIYSLGYLLSGLSMMSKNPTPEAETYLQEGIKMCKTPVEATSSSLSTATKVWNDKRLGRIMLLLYACFSYCGKAEWDKAATGIARLRKDIESELESKPTQHISTLITYLDGVCSQGSGDLPRALKMYQADDLKIPLDPDSQSTAKMDPIKILAALNSVVILRMKDLHAEADQVLENTEPYCKVHVNSNGNEYGSKAIEAAYYVVMASSAEQHAPDGTIIKTKEYLQKAVQAAKGIPNNQLLCIVMNIMTESFFKNIVGDQAEKSARSGRTLAKQCHHKLWIAVADRMYGDTLEKCGKKQEAEQIRWEAQEAMQRLPSSLVDALASGVNGPQ